MQWSLHDQLAIAHALFACIAVLFTLPIALLAGRYLRGGSRWFKVHVIFNTATTLLIILVFGLGMGAVASQDQGTQFNGPNSDLHHKVGLAVFLITLVQSLLGVVSHYFPARHISRRVHVGFGLIVSAGMYWETWEGLHNEWAEMSVSMTVVPASVQILFWVFFLLPAVAWGIAVGQKALNGVTAKEADATSVSSKADDEKHMVPML